jgi:hypothetical protein
MKSAVIRKNCAGSDDPLCSHAHWPARTRMLWEGAE